MVTPLKKCLCIFFNFLVFLTHSCMVGESVLPTVKYTLLLQVYLLTVVQRSFSATSRFCGIMYVGFCNNKSNLSLMYPFLLYTRFRYMCYFSTTPAYRFSPALEIHFGSRQLPRILPRQTVFLK